MLEILHVYGMHIETYIAKNVVYYPLCTYEIYKYINIGVGS